MALTFRGQKGTSLTHDELDNNFREFYYSASYDGSGLFLYKSQSLNNVTNLPFQAPVGRDQYIQFKVGNAPSGSQALFSGSNKFKFDYRENKLQLTGSQNITGNLIVGGTVTAEEFITEKVATSYIYKSGSSKFGDDSNDNHAFTGSVEILGDLKLVGPQTQTGDLTITGSLLVSGSPVQFNLPWPSSGGEDHFILGEPFVVNISGSNDRTYNYSAFTMEHIEDVTNYEHHAFKLYMYDNDVQIPEYGSELLVGPLRVQMKLAVSGSDSLGNISVIDRLDNTSAAVMYADTIEIGVFESNVIQLGNPSSSIVAYAPFQVRNNSTFLGDTLHVGNSSHTGTTNLTGSLYVSGSPVQFTLPWPAEGEESHFIYGEPFTVNITGSNDRTYNYSAFTMEHIEDVTNYQHHAFKLYMYDNDVEIPEYGSELLVGPLRVQMKIAVSGSDSLGNISVIDKLDNTSAAVMYADTVEIGVFESNLIELGNLSSSIVTYAPMSIQNSAEFRDNLIHRGDILLKSTGSIDLAGSASIGGDLTVTNTLTTNDLVVIGTGSFGYIQSVTGSAKIIGDAYIVLNNNTPSEPYAGIKVFDSGSSGETGSLEYDSNNNHWFYQSTNEGYAAALISGERGTRGSLPTPTINTLVKGLGGNHIGDSIISDSGSVATVTGDLVVTGIITGTLTGSIENAVSASYIDYNNVVNTPTIPTNNNQLTNGAGYITAASIPTNVSSFTNDAGYTTYTSNQATNTTSNVTFNTINATGDIVAYASSDERLKDNIQVIPNAVEKVQQIKGVSFDWNGNQATHEGHDIGVIAQDIEKILPEIVTTRDNGYKAVRYEKLVALLIEAVKEQQLQIDELKSKL